jgi:hypothetical protein
MPHPISLSGQITKLRAITSNFLIAGALLGVSAAIATAQPTQIPPDPLTSELWDLFKVIAPWLTGGLAGAMLTYLLNQRLARRKQAKVLVKTERVDYSIAASDEHFKELRVSYGGTEFDNLLLFQLSIENVSSRTIQRAPLFLFFQQETRFVEQSSRTQPLRREIALVRQAGDESAYLWDAGELKPKDTAQLRLLLTPTAPVDWAWRGDDDVEVITYGREATQTIERELRNVIIWIALYIFIGAVPFFSEIARALLLVVSTPYIISYCIRWWQIITALRTPRWHINAQHGANVAIPLVEERRHSP